MSSSEISKEILNFLLKIVETSINELIQTFFSTPYLFYTENDLHCYLYRLLSEGLEDAGYGTYETLDKKLTNLLHKEYPTKQRYRKPQKDDTGKRGHFDLCIWNPEKVDIRLFRSKNSKEIEDEQQTYFAFEFLLAEGRGRSTLKKAIDHTNWDKLKLEENEVKYGYILVFARDWSFGEEFLREIRKIKIPRNIALVYAERSNGKSIFETL